MKVAVRLFARAKDLAGAEVVTLDLPEGAYVGDLRRRLAEEYPPLASLLPRSAVAVDNEFAEDGFALRNGAEVALLPPVSGG
jgi:molybdopterin synthase catalytic subunit